jgi:hypothetical protein
MITVKQQCAIHASLFHRKTVAQNNTGENNINISKHVSVLALRLRLNAG